MTARIYRPARNAMQSGKGGRYGRSCKVLNTMRANGRSTKIRTLDPRFPKPVLYQAELHSDVAPFR